MPVRKCKTCGHAYFMHAGSDRNTTGGGCMEMRRKADGTKISPCDCQEYIHDPQSGPFGQPA